MSDSSQTGDPYQTCRFWSLDVAAFELVTSIQPVM
jgi:hypothetical protein